MPFLAAGDPELSTTAELIRLLAGCGVDLIEIGFPYSDPIADGPVIQEAYTRALAKKIGVADIFGALETLRGETLPPLLAMVAYAIVYRAGPEKFAAAAKRAGFSGLIVPDLPGDQAAELFAIAQRTTWISFSSWLRRRRPSASIVFCRSSSGFVYCIAVAGTTGVRHALPNELKSELETLRLKTKLPLAVGFGIGRADQIDSLRGLADGVIVGSAIVRHIGRLSSGDAPRAAVMEELARFTRELSAAAHQGGPAPEPK